MGKSTISTGPFSIANCKRLPEGNIKKNDLANKQIKHVDLKNNNPRL